MKLQAKTLKGKNRIKELGDEWWLIKTSDTVAFAQRNGPWGYVRPAKKGGQNHERWIHLIDDHDFDIVSF